jgi:hypothetical protein
MNAMLDPRIDAASTHEPFLPRTLEVFRGDAIPLFDAPERERIAPY